MKTKVIMIVLAVVLVTVGFLTSCEMISSFIENRTRPIPLIQVYNSNFEKTLRMLPNDTLYVEARGLKPGGVYSVQAQDPENKPIATIVVQANDEGVIDPTALWYDIGFRRHANGQLYLDMSADIDLKSFHIRVFNEEGTTDFRLPFFIVNSTAGVSRPKPIVMAGKILEDQFFMENAFYSDGNVPDPDDIKSALEATLDDDDDDIDNYIIPEYTDELWVSVEHMSPLTPGDYDSAVYDSKARIWILPFSGEIYEEGQLLSSKAWFFQDFEINELVDAQGRSTPVKINWPIKNGVPNEAPDRDLPINMNTIDTNAFYEEMEKIPEWAEEMAFSVFVDMMYQGMAGYYNIKKNVFAEGEEESDTFYLDGIDGNGVAGFIVRKPPKQPANFTEVDLASGGMFGWDRLTNMYSYDYRDEFIFHGRDTKYAPWYRVPYGIKIIWNPYGVSSYWGVQNSTQMESLYWGRVVDVYVVDKALQPTLNAGVKIGGDNLEYLATGTIMQSLAVQSGCGNGLGMQNIWNAPMALGDYYVIVDIDRTGKINENCLVHEFKVVQNY